ncbi:membrane progestin receptor gamma isoform X2 [Bombina bombina]|uniref:membrane progestin receptor gamma isoform X2 n=1 Tax=Bombina bombina TaxID=8345 RepID=UPI00235AD7B3|nr:membrane progestin receptor gamma isoform X2 [Bombina bombina]
METETSRKSQQEFSRETRDQKEQHRGVRYNLRVRTMLSWKLPRLLTVQQVPKVFHEESIISGYRSPRSSATACVLSLFQMTNETLNIWTHFIPTWYFLWRMLTLLYSPGSWDDPFLWPLLVFLLSCCIYPLTSSCAHTFSVMSVQARHICFFLDYGAVSLYSLGSAVAYSAYVFPDRWVNSPFHRWYVTCAVLNTVICTGLSCYSRFQEETRPRLSKVLRTGAFAYPYLFDSLPLFYRLFLCSGSGCTQNASIIIHKWHTIFAFLTAFLFSTHLPERLAPGHFDYVGHSHQLFHVCAVLGTYFQLEALIKDMTLRRDWLLESSPVPSFSSTLGAWSTGMAISLLVIMAFSWGLYWKPVTQRKKQNN